MWEIMVDNITYQCHASLWKNRVQDAWYVALFFHSELELLKTLGLGFPVASCKS